MAPDGIPLDGRNVLDDPAMERVLALQAKVKELERMKRALQRDRDDLLVEFIDLRDAREVPRSPTTPRPHDPVELVRVVCGDLHGMRMDASAVDALLKDIHTIDPDEVILLGDWLECGGWLSKHHVIGYVALADYSYQEDVKAANWVLDQIQAVAPHATFTMLEGNHEQRIERWAVDQTQSHGRDADMLMRAFGPAAVLRLEDRGITYIRRADRLTPGFPPGWLKLGKMCFVHELGKGKNAARSAVTQSALNVTFGHTHRADSMLIRYPGIGVVAAHSPGCLSELQPMWRHTDPTEWNHGYDIHIVARSGRFQHIHVPIQDGESLGGDMVARFSGQR